ncbi:hypothetical protein AALP_AA5G228900 [Arabis alpina]|uniref:MATH domain-containing protein n=1 Tax=Arabis alpina TaxID=50452 RepID=A0A087GYV4_ARAAL|nr:hypothetical protein AALP_AA5G228900 [Arabis alpina]
MAKQVDNKFAWIIKDFSSLKCTKHSNPVLIGNCKWRLNASPQQGNGTVTKESQRWFDEKSFYWGFPSMIPLAKLHDKNEAFIVNGELRIVAEVDLQVIGTSEECQEMNHLKKLKVESVEFRAMNKHMKKAGTNVLISLTQMLCETRQELSIDDLVEAENAVAYMKNSGVNVDWLEKKLEEIKEKKE